RKKRQQHGSVRAQLCSLLLQHPACGLAHFLGGNVLAIHFRHNALAGRTRQVTAQIARDKSNHHGSANQQQKPAEHNFLEWSFSLQKSNHLVTPEVGAESIIMDYITYL